MSGCLDACAPHKASRAAANLWRPRLAKTREFFFHVASAARMALMQTHNYQARTHPFQLERYLQATRLKLMLARANFFINHISLVCHLLPSSLLDLSRLPPSLSSSSPNLSSSAIDFSANSKLLKFFSFLSQCSSKSFNSHLLVQILISISLRSISRQLDALFMIILS